MKKTVKKIIYVHETFFRKHRDMGIELFRGKGYEVELWSTLKIKYKKTLDFPKDNVDDYVLYFENHLQIIKQIFKQDWKHTICFFTTTAHRGGVEDFMRIIIGMAAGKYCNFIYEIAPIGSISLPDNKNFMGKIKTVGCELKYDAYQFLIKKYFKPTFCFVPTYYATENLLTAQERKVAIEVHNKDYDEILINNSQEVEKNGEQYILFLDSDLTGAEDFKKSNIPSIYPTEFEYFDSINKVFDQLERFYGVSVYIAAHPKNEYKGDRFKGRKIFYYQTSELVRNAKLVLTHASVSVNFIIMYRKPFIYLVDKNIRKHMIWQYLFLPQIKELKITQYRFDREKEPWRFINQPNRNYDLYEERYVKHANFNGKLFYEIVEEVIRKI